MPAGKYYPQIVVIPAQREDKPGLVSTQYLKAYWRLDDINDSWFNGLTLTNNNSVSFKRGKFGNCAKANGSSSYLSRASSSTTNPNLDNFEFLLLMRDIKGSGTKTIIDKFSGTSIGYKIEINKATGTVTFTIGTSTGGIKSVSTTVDCADGKWKKLVFYVDRAAEMGILVDSRTAKTTTSLVGWLGILDNTVELRFSANQTPTQYWGGELEDVRYYRGGLLDAKSLDIWFDSDKRYIVTEREERGLSLECDYADEKCKFSFNVSGKNWLHPRRFAQASQCILLYDVLSMASLRGLWAFQNTLDDESVTENDWVKQAGANSFISGGGINADGTVWYKITDDESLAFKSNRLHIAGRMRLPAFTGTKQTILSKGSATQSIYIYTSSGANTLNLEIMTAGVLRAITYTYTPATDFKWSLDWDGTNLRFYVSGVLQGSPVSATGSFDNTFDDLALFAKADGTERAPSGVKLYYLRIYEKTLTTSEISDLNSLTLPTIAAIFDGIILAQPTVVDGKKPFTVMTREYLYDRLTNDYLTIQFSGKWKLGVMMRTAIARTSLSADFDTSNIVDGTKEADGKFFIREQMTSVFQWITDNAGTEFYVERRGMKRYLFHVQKESKHSNVIIGETNILLPYKYEPEIYQQTNSVLIEGGHVFTTEEQQTFDNGTTKSSNGIYYAIKSTPENLLYGQLEVKMQSVGTLFEDLHMEIREDVGGSPGPLLTGLSETDIPTQKITGTLALVPSDLDVVLDRTKTYWLVLSPNGDASNRISYADNGGAADTNMKTSPDGSAWSAVGYTFVYNWKRKERVVTEVKDSAKASQYQIRRVKITDDTLTDKATAKQIAKGILFKVSRVHRHVDSMRIKDIVGLPQPKQLVRLIHSDNDLDDDLVLQNIRVEMHPGKGGFFDHCTISAGDEKMEPEQLYRQMYQSIKTILASGEPPRSDTEVHGESLMMALRFSGRRVPPYKISKNIGIDINYDAAAFRQLPKSDMLWDTDDIGGYDVDNKYEDGAMDSDDL